ncbi:MAG: SRPBCC domain-containing protein [Propionibacteriaceae bacterium]|jgi:hypothetical protein|nr:SRPBCC domain-containing protein [Propionibacteriaceae bacterium]
MTTELLIENHTADTTAVAAVVPEPAKLVWARLLTTTAQEALLGPGAALGDKGDRWQSADGCYGVVRSYHPLEKVRFSWHETDEAPRTWVELRLEPIGPDHTRVEIVHDHTGVTVDAAQLSARWKGVLEALTP